MIIWGSRGEVDVIEAQEHKHCPTCAKERTFLLRLQYKVSHIWFIFQWVSEKQYALVCDFCYRGEKLSAKSVEDRLGKPAIPFMERWGWAFLVALFAGFCLFNR